MKSRDSVDSVCFMCTFILIQKKGALKKKTPKNMKIHSYFSHQSLSFPVLTNTVLFSSDQRRWRLFVLNHHFSAIFNRPKNPSTKWNPFLFFFLILLSHSISSYPNLRRGVFKQFDILIHFDSIFAADLFSQNDVAWRHFVIRIVLLHFVSWQRHTPTQAKV